MHPKMKAVISALLIGFAALHADNSPNPVHFTYPYFDGKENR